MAHVTVTVTCAQLIKSTPAEIYQSFVEPTRLTGSGWNTPAHRWRSPRTLAVFRRLGRSPCA
jgi:hypothetical protein